MRMAFRGLLARIDALVDGTARDEMDGGVSPADRGADFVAPDVKLRELLVDVELVASSPTVEAARDLVDAVARYEFSYEYTGIADARRRFAEGARHDLRIDP
ncbi:hypothetical protein CGZ93_10350 [Enemella dayhoffiae]|uniref:Uncharacterized protein n=2 Tax=Enemella dayhoffiae TaxID=2016507 RepID=A0A255H1D5_9ACTN|nr:hypothetical protein CGZ93_10350 [Enemella dayhoffiae]